MTHIKGTWFACGVLALAWMTPAGAYDAETHALITYKAYQSSVLLPTEASGTVARLGLDRLDPPSPFNTYWQATAGALGPVSYYDNTGATVHQRQPNEYERCQMEDLAKVAIIGSTTGYFDPADPMLSGAGIPKVAFLPVQNWLMRGVLREDDVWSILYKTIAKEDCGQPDTDPYGSISRVFNHFYDPIHDNGLSIGIKSIDWALGYVDSFDTPLVVDTNRRNHFTYVDARENMWRALTGESGLVALPYTGLAHAADAQERLYRWATTFRALGDVVHLLQDGASPQHVRNDIHSPIGTSQEQQAFEGFTNARVRGLPISKTNAYVRGFFPRLAARQNLACLAIGQKLPGGFVRHAHSLLYDAPQRPGRQRFTRRPLRLDGLCQPRVFHRRDFAGHVGEHVSASAHTGRRRPQLHPESGALCAEQRAGEFMAARFEMHALHA